LYIQLQISCDCKTQ